MRIPVRKLIVLAISCQLLSGVAYAQVSIPNHCQTTPVRSTALDWPSKHAWDLFLVLNHPAVDEKQERGRPDCTKRLGAPGTTAVWETWRNAESEVFLADGSDPPHWNDTSLPDEEPAEVPELRLAATGPTRRVLSFHNASGILKSRFSPDGIFQGRGGIGETRMNRSTYEVVKRECLFSVEGQERYAKAVLAGKKPPLTFPTDSMEVKAVWLDFEREKIPSAKHRNYYTATSKGKKYGLVALHVVTKDIPNWFWATFHHVDSPHNEFETEDTFGRPSALNGTVWENYRLGGTQIDFVAPNGSPTILSDHYVEFQFQRSSCISCHATATMSPDGSDPLPGQPLALCSLSPNIPGVIDPKTCKSLIGEFAFKPGTDELVAERGPPDPRWFEKDGKQYYQQSDFLWSMPFRAQNETAPPPARCLWQ